MRHVYENEIEEEIKFAKEAAKHFAEHKEHNTYSNDEIVKGCFLAIRWGLFDDCVLVVKLDENHEPTNYGNLIRKYQ